MRTRSPLLGVLLGIVALAVIVGFAVGLGGEDGESGGAGLPADPFPDRLAQGGLVSYEQLDQIEGLQVSPEQLAGAMAEQSAYAEERLAEVFRGEVAIAAYAAPDLTVQAEVTVFDGEPGLFKPGLPSDPTAQHAGPWFEAVRYGEVRCFVAWASDRQTSDAGGLPGAVQCQRGDGGRTFDIRATGMGAQDAAAALNEVVTHARAQDQ